MAEMDEKKMALDLLSHKTKEKMKHSLTGEQILSVDDVNEVLLIAGMPQIEKGV